MTSLREEFNKNKQQKEHSLTEGAVRWVMENVVLLGENFNRDSLQRLQGSIAKFDSIFAPYGAKVPEVKRSLDDAVELMNRITMGEKITRNDGRLRLTQEESEALKEPATYMVKYMSILYNNLSRFFSKDMKVLMDFPIFRMAVQNPTVPLRDLAEAPRMHKALLHALAPGPEAQALLKRMYKSMELPNLDYGTIADQLLNLTANDFKQLTQVEKVPLVATPQVATEASVTPAAQPVSPMEAATSRNPKDQNGDEKLLAEEEFLIKEFGEINQAQMTQVTNGIQKIQGIIKAFPELQQTNQALEQLRSQAFAAQAGGWGKPSSKSVAATANVVYNYFDKLGDLGSRLDTMIPSGRPMTPEELENLKTILTKSEGGIMAKVGNYFNTRVNPLLSPSNLTSQIIQVISAGQQGQNPQAAGDSIKNFFKRIQQLKLPPAVNQQGVPVVQAQAPGTAPAQGTAGAQPAAQAAPGATPATAAGSAQTGATAAPGAAGAAAPAPQSTIGTTQFDMDELAKAMKVTKSDIMVQQVTNLQNAGWKIIPPSR